MPPQSYPDTLVGHWRRHMAVTQAEASQALGMAKQNYVALEQGRTRLDRRTELAMLRLAKAPERCCSLEDFLA
jgi:DNA-binding XRE family transcriptional regulator